RPEAADRLIALLGQQAREMADRLRDPQQTAFEWVTLPEELAVPETEDAIAALERAGIHVDELIVNRILPAGAPCPICDPRRAREAHVIAAIRRHAGRGRELRFVPAEIRQPRGARALVKI